MLLEADELSEILRKEQEYIDDLKKRWGTRDLSKKSEHDLRMGKRTELLCDLQCRKERQEAVAASNPRSFDNLFLSPSDKNEPAVAAEGDFVSDSALLPRQQGRV